MTDSNKLARIKGFFTYDSFEGDKIKPFYLPIRRIPTRFGYECWVFPIALFVIVYYLITSLLWRLWRDLVEILYLLNKRHND